MNIFCKTPRNGTPSPDKSPVADRCAGCPIFGTRKEARCDPSASCVRTTYARHIERFFRQNPHWASAFWKDDYFEVRAIVTRHLPQEILKKMIKDPDETVRMNVALFLAPGDLVRMMNDSEREVRIRVATRIPESLLPMMAADPDYYVRHQVARRIVPTALFFMKNDRDPEVRRVVAGRIPAPHYASMLSDRDALVRVAVLERGEEALWMKAVKDHDVRVRFWLAEHAKGEALRHMTGDPDPFIRRIAERRVRDDSYPQDTIPGKAAS